MEKLRHAMVKGNFVTQEHCRVHRATSCSY